MKYIPILLLSMILLLSACTENSDNAAASLSQPEQTTETAAVVHNTEEGEPVMVDYDFSIFENVELIGIEPNELSDEELSVLYRQAQYCQAMTDADIDLMREIVSENMIFTHMSGRQQTREEYFADIAAGQLNYFTIGIENPIIDVEGDIATITFTSVLNANAYGARGTFRMNGTHKYEKRDGVWIAVNR